MKKIYINGKFKFQRRTGVQRYAEELTKVLLSYPEVELISPPKLMRYPVLLIIWEQLVLPFFAFRGKLVSLCNIGPVIHPNHFLVIHDLAVFENQEWFSKKFAIYYKVMIPVLAFFAKKIFTVSFFSKNEIKKHLGIKAWNKTTVAHNGVNLNQFFVDNQGGRGLSKNYILCVASIEPRKNFERIFEAWRLVDSHYREGVELVVVGGRNSRVFSDISTADCNITFTGYVSDADLVNLYQNARGFLYPSLYEGFGLPVLEALACGTPVLVSENSAMSEIYGGHGVEVNAYSVDSIREGIVEILNNQEYYDYDAIRSELSAKYSWKLCGSKIIAGLSS